MLEALYTQKVKAELSKYFEMNPEVWDYTMKSRIDYVATCKESGAAFGIEVKKTDYKRGEDIGNLIKQAMRYSQCEFPIKGGSYMNCTPDCAIEGVLLVTPSNIANSLGFRICKKSSIS